MSYQTVVMHCAPTLAGIKVGSLFTVRISSAAELHTDISEKNKLLNHKGLYFIVLKIKDCLALIYVYRPKQLSLILEDLEVQQFLSNFGYQSFDIISIFTVLKEHLLRHEFPHEIGVILGYPLQDIKDFITDNGTKPCYVGCWKAYSNQEYAKKIHQKFLKCTDIYQQKIDSGFDIIKLTVAC